MCIFQTGATIDPCRQACDALQDRYVRLVPTVTFAIELIAPTFSYKSASNSARYGSPVIKVTLVIPLQYPQWAHSSGHASRPSDSVCRCGHETASGQILDGLRQVHSGLRRILRGTIITNFLVISLVKPKWNNNISPVLLRITPFAHSPVEYFRRPCKCIDSKSLSLTSSHLTNLLLLGRSSVRLSPYRTLATEASWSCLRLSTRTEWTWGRNCSLVRDHTRPNSLPTMVSHSISMETSRTANFPLT